MSWNSQFNTQFYFCNRLHLRHTLNRIWTEQAFANPAIVTHVFKVFELSCMTMMMIMITERRRKMRIFEAAQFWGHFRIILKAMRMCISIMIKRRALYRIHIFFQIFNPTPNHKPVHYMSSHLTPCHVYTDVWIICTSININNNNTRATSYGKGSMKPNGFMSSLSGNTPNNIILVGANVQRVQGNYHHFDSVLHR